MYDTRVKIIFLKKGLNNSIEQYPSRHHTPAHDSTEQQDTTRRGAVAAHGDVDNIFRFELRDVSIGRLGILTHTEIHFYPTSIRTVVSLAPSSNQSSRQKRSFGKEKTE